jgi:hypothetical protein
VSSHVEKFRKAPLTCPFVSWAVTGSNRRPLRCKSFSSRFQDDGVIPVQRWFSMFPLVKPHFRLALGWTWLDSLPLLMLHICSTTKGSNASVKAASWTSARDEVA